MMAPSRRAYASWWSRPTPFDKGYLWFVVVAVLGPFIPLAIWSFTFNWFWPSLLPTRWWWEGRQVVRQLLAWDYIFSPVSQVGTAIVNTLVIGVIVTLLSILVGVPAARVLARREFRGKQMIEFFLLTPLIVPGIAISLGLVVIFIRI